MTNKSKLVHTLSSGDVVVIPQVTGIREVGDCFAIFLSGGRSVEIPYCCSSSEVNVFEMEAIKNPKIKNNSLLRMYVADKVAKLSAEREKSAIIERDLILEKLHDYWDTKMKVFHV